MCGPRQLFFFQCGTDAKRLGTPDIKGDFNRNTVIMGDFNIPLISVDRSSRQKINKETVTLNDRLDQIDLIDYLQSISLQIYRLLKCTWNVF